MNSRWFMKMYDILALVELSEEVPRPKVKGVVSGYSPHHKFHQVEYLASGFTPILTIKLTIRGRLL